MTIGFLGVLLTVMGITFLVCRIFKIHHLVFFSAPFFDFPIMTLTGTKLVPLHVFGLIMIVGFLLRSLFHGRMLLGKDNMWLLLFSLVILFSMFMPFFHEGISVVTMDTSYLEYEYTKPLKFSVANLTQLLFPAFMILLFLSATHYLSNDVRIQEGYHSFLFGTIVVVFSGFLIQSSLLLFGSNVLAYIVHILQGNVDVADVLARIEQYNTFNGIPRMYSLAGEPGFTASLLLITSIILSVEILLHKVITISKYYNLKLFALAIMIVALILTGSTFAYAGVLFAFIIIPLYMIWAGKKFNRIAIKAYSAVTIVMIIFSAVFSLSDDLLTYFIGSHVGKIADQSGSGEIRLETMIFSMNVFSESILLGVGYGSHRSGALATAILSNIGLLGFITFIMFNYSKIANAISISNKAEGISGALAIGCSIGIMVWLFISLFATSLAALSFGWYWLTLAMLSACYNVSNNTEKNRLVYGVSSGKL